MLYEEIKKANVQSMKDKDAVFKNIQTSKNRSEEDEIEANIGGSNLFAFLNVGLRGNTKSGSNDGKTVIEEKTHTTVSLFQRLKAQLEDAELIKREVEKIEELMKLVDLFSDKPKSKQSKKDKLMADNKFNAQIEGLIDGLQAGGKKDIICETTDIKVILPTDENYFLNNNMSEVTDGNYKILGKVAQIYKDSGEISLLRNTVFSRLQLDKMNEFQDIFNDPALLSFVGNEGITTTIQAPVIMIIPIAIYI